MAPGDSFKLRYRFVFHAGTTEEANIKDIYKDYSAQ